MERTDFTAQTGTGPIGGWTAGDGPPVVLLHGGPGLSYGHLDPLVEELALGFQVATFQQRGLAPSATEGEFTVAEGLTDITAVLDHLGWDRAYLVGHSWGGHLAFHAAVSIPGRLLGVLSVDPLGGVGDGAAGEFAAEMLRRVPQEHRARAEELEERDTAGTATEADLQESLDLYWPSYFADPNHVMPRPPLTASLPAHYGLWADLIAHLPALEQSLASITVPLGVVVGEHSPMPPETAGLATVARIPGAWSCVQPGAGHFVWFESPGCVLNATRRLAGTAN